MKINKSSEMAFEWSSFEYGVGKICYFAYASEVEQKNRKFKLISNMFECK